MRTSGCWAPHRHVAKDSTGDEKSGGCFRKCSPRAALVTRAVFGKDGNMPRWSREWGLACAAMGHCKGHCWHSACTWSGNESDGRAAPLAGAGTSAGEAAGRCRDTADVCLRFPVNPDTHRLYILSVAQGCFLSNMRCTQNLQRRSEEAENQVRASEVSLVQPLEQPPPGFRCCSWSQAALDCSHSVQGYAPGTAWCTPVPEPKRSREHCLMRFRALVASEHCKLHLPSSKAQTFADILYYVSVALLCLFCIKATIKMQAN